MGKDDRAVEVVDIHLAPERALALRVLVTPTLLWSGNPFGQRLIGDLSSEVELAAFLESWTAIRPTDRLQ